MVCKRGLADVLLTLIENPATPKSTGSPQNHGFRARRTKVAP